MEENTSINITIDALRNMPLLWYKIHVLIWDLRNFNGSLASQKRLETVVDPSYIGMPYFTDTEAQLIKNAMVNDSSPFDNKKRFDNKSSRSSDTHKKTLETLIEETLNERLERRMKKRVDSGDFRVCTAHDLAPILEMAVNVKSKELASDEHFLSLMEKSGLKLKAGDLWNGPPKKSFHKKLQKR